MVTCSVQWSVKSVCRPWCEQLRRRLQSCACRVEYRWCSNCISTPKFIQTTTEQDDGRFEQENPGFGNKWVLESLPWSWLEWGSSLQLIQKVQGENSGSQGQGELLDKCNKSLWTSWGILLSQRWSGSSQMKRVSARISFTIPKTTVGLPASHVMVFVCIFGGCDVKLLHIFEQDLRYNSDSCMKLLGTVVKSQSERVTAWWPYMWQQDLTPCHTSRKS